VAAVTMPVAVVGGELLTVKFHQPSHEFTFGVGISYTLSIGTNPLGITNLFVHVGFVV
jgi:hypothetical protein